MAEVTSFLRRIASGTFVDIPIGDGDRRADHRDHR